MADGIDVSKWQGDSIDWKAVYSSGQRFAVARSSIAGRSKDETFVRNYKGMVAADLIPGAYHLVSGLSDGPTQAQNFKEALDAAEFDKGLLVLDVEGWAETLNGNEAGTLAATKYLADWIRRTYNRTPIIYTGVYWRDNLKQHSNNFGSELWLSYYGTNPVENYVPSAWSTWKMWQYTDTGSVPGVAGNVDMNKSAGTLKSLRELAGWEWDELATEAQVRAAVQAVVAEEVQKAVATLTSVDNNNTVVINNALSGTGDLIVADITSAVREAEVRLSADITANRHDATLNKEETLFKFNEVLDAIATNVPAVEDYTEEILQIQEAIDNLHRHVCNRVDLHY